jgi:nitrite reductase/ring-hydroxylating ferredoxin subunit
MLYSSEIAPQDVVADALPDEAMDTPTPDVVHVDNREESKTKGRLVVRGRHRPILFVHENGRVFTLDNSCPHLGFPLHRGSIEDSILTCHWHHARSRSPV